MNFIENINIENKKVFIRVDFNVPMKDGKITDDTRIKAAMPTINYALSQNAVIILASHLGRPSSREDSQFSLTPVASHLSSLLQKEVKMADDCIGENVENLISKSLPGAIIILENLRFYPEEKKDDENFASKLADLCDVYVNNAFAVCHRKHASVSAIVKYAKEAVMGHLLKTELENYDKAINKPERPLAAIIGGAKVSSKLGALKNMLKTVDKVIIGGAMANTFFKAKGINIGKSLYEENMIDSAKDILSQAKENNVEIFLPVDAIIAEKCDEEASPKECELENIPQDHMILDIGKKTVTLFKQALEDTKTIVWNGPMGVFEIDAFSKGTMKIASIISSSKAFTIIGGGDTDAAVHKAGLAEKMDYISTGGGAFLTLMEGKPLPAVEMLMNQ